MTEQKTAEEKVQGPETIGKRGPRLPLGIQLRGETFQDIAVRRWRMKEERQLGELRDEHKDANLAVYVSIVLATMCTRLGPHDFDKMSLVERRLAISQMYLGDVMYAYVWLRIKSLGSDFHIKFKPPMAKEALDITADLNTVEVAGAESIEAAVWEYELADPIELRGHTVSKFKLGPVRWATMENVDQLGQSENLAVVKEAMLQASIFGTDQHEALHLTDSDLDELSKLDIERLTTAIDENSIGPIMKIDGEYRRRPYSARIDWGYDSFFAVSST